MSVVGDEDPDDLFASLPTPIPPATAPAAAPAAAAAAAASAEADADDGPEAAAAAADVVALPHSPVHLVLGAVNALPKALLGWPLDTTKTLLQTTTDPSRYPPPLRTVRVLQTTVREHGVRGLYKGVGGPAAGWACIDAGVLGGLWKARSWLYDGGWRETHDDDVGGGGSGEERLTIAGHVVAGGLAGLMVVPLAHPIDLVKSRLQFALRLPSAADAAAAAAATASSPASARAAHPRPLMATSTAAAAARSRRLAYPHLRSYQPIVHLPCANSGGGGPSASIFAAGFFTPSSVATSSSSSSSTTLPLHAQAAHGLRPCSSGGPRYLSSTVPRPPPPRAPIPAAAAVDPAVRLGPYDTLRAAYSQGGLFRGVYRALPWTAVCRAGMGLMFGTYEVLLRAQERAWGGRRAPTTTTTTVTAAAGGGREVGLGKAGQTFVAGALSSLVFWTVFLPADNIKATLLTDAVDPAERRFPTSRAAIAYIYGLSAPGAAVASSSSSSSSSGRSRTDRGGRSGGVSWVARALAGARRLKPFWRGGGAVVARASVVNGVGLVLWEGAMTAVGESTLS